MVAVTAAVIHGVLGITPTWERLEVTPHLPADWPRAEAEVLYKGRRHRVTIEAGKVKIEPLEQVISLPLLWVMDFNLRTVARRQGNGHERGIPRTVAGDSVALKKILRRQGAHGALEIGRDRRSRCKTPARTSTTGRSREKTSAGRARTYAGEQELPICGDDVAG